MSLNHYQEAAARMILNNLPDEWQEEPVQVPHFCGEIIDPKAAFNPRHDPVTSKIKHLRLLQDEIATFPSTMAPQVLTLHVRKHYGTLYKDLKEILRQEYLPMLASRIDWSVGDRLTMAGFTVCYNKQTDLLQIKVGESAIEL